MKLSTSKELYHYESESGHIEALKSLGFTFEDWGNGFVEISGEPEMDLMEVGIFQNWVEVLVGNGRIQILDWMSTQQMMGG